MASAQPATKQTTHSLQEAPSGLLPPLNSEATGQTLQILDERTSAAQPNTQQPALEPQDSAMIKLNTLEKLVDLAETNGEMLLAARIRNHVQLVSLKPGNLQITLIGAAPDQLAGDIARYLSQWTNQRWLVSLSESGGEKTLAEQQRDSDEKLHEKIVNEPLIVRVLDIFPGAKIDEIKSPDITIASAADSSAKTPLLTDMNDDEEEMSG